MCAITLVVEYLFICLEVLKYLYEIVETIGGGVEPPNEHLLLPLAGKCKLDEIDYFFIGDYLDCSKQREVLKVIHNLIYAENELTHLGVLGIKQALS